MKDRITLSEHIALLFRLGYLSYNYTKIETEGDDFVLET